MWYAGWIPGDLDISNLIGDCKDKDRRRAKKQQHKNQVARAIALKKTEKGIRSEC